MFHKITHKHAASMNQSTIMLMNANTCQNVCAIVIANMFLSTTTNAYAILILAAQPQLQLAAIKVNCRICERGVDFSAADSS